MTVNRRIARRGFIRQVSGGALALSLATGAVPALGGPGANEKVNLGFIGVGDRNRLHLRHFGHKPDVNTCGGNYVYHDNRETPDTAEVVFTCPDYTFTYSVREANSRPLTRPS